MRDSIIEVLRIIAPLSVALIVFAEALQIAPAQVVRCFSERSLVMLRSLLAALVLVPVVALALILLFEPQPAVGVALAILVACPPAPLMIKNATKLGGGDRAFIAGLHLSLAALAVLTVPAVLSGLATPLGFSSHAGVDPSALVSIMARTILVPIGLGMAVRALFPAWANRYSALLGKAGSVGLLLVVVALAGALFPALLNLDVRSYGAIATVCVAALAIGHVLGPPSPAHKTILAIECAVRHPALAISIATTNFSADQALPVLVPCVLTIVAIATAYLAWRGRTAQ